LKKSDIFIRKQEEGKEQSMRGEVTMEDLERTAWTIRKKLIEMFSYGNAHRFGESGTAEELLAKHGLDADGIVKSAAEVMKKR
jgi:transketolase